MEKSIRTGIVANIFRIFLGFFLIFAGYMHTTAASSEYALIIPSFLSNYADSIVLVSGIIEIILGLALIFLVKYTAFTGWMVAIFLVLIFPANIYQYINEINAFGMNDDNARLSRLFVQPIFILWALISTGALRAYKRSKNKNISFYDFKAQSLNKQELNMSEYKDKVVLVVNTASKCGLTPQYEGLEELYKKYKDQGLVILGFPCNQFMNQEPGDEKSISQNCLLNYGVTFQMFSKIEVNGENTHPLYKYLKTQLGGVFSDKIKWNFTKFLIDKNGNPIKRFAPSTKPQKLEKYIQELLAQRKI